MVWELQPFARAEILNISSSGSSVSPREGLDFISTLPIRCRKLKLIGGSVCGSNAPVTSKMPPTGFEDRGHHRMTNASVAYYQRLPVNRSPFVSLFSRRR